MAQQINIPDILDIRLADKQTKRLAACTPGQRIRVTAGTIWLTVSANKHPCVAGDVFLTEGQTYRMEHAGDAVIEAIGGAAHAQLAGAVDPKSPNAGLNFSRRDRRRISPGEWLSVHVSDAAAGVI